MLAHSFTVGLPPLLNTDWIADSGASFHTTPDAAILSSVRPPHPSRSIIVGNGSCLPVTSVGNAGTHGPFRLPNILVAPTWFTIFSPFANLQLTTPILSSLTPPVLP